MELLSALRVGRDPALGLPSDGPLSELIDALGALPGVADLTTLRGLLTRPGLVEAACPLARFTAESRCRRVLYRDDHVELVIIGWLPGQRAALHGHGESNCAFRVLQGAASERWVGAAALGPSGLLASTHHVGEVAEAAPGGWHELATDGDVPLVTLHAYSPPLSARSALPTIAVVGGGASAVALARATSPSAANLLIIERAPVAGLGAAYDADPNALLNVPAGRMSILASDPSDFVRWAKAQGEAVHPDDYAPRALYGRYLRAALATAGPHVRRVHDEVVDATPVGSLWRVSLASGARLHVDGVVLATGNPAPSLPTALKAARRQGLSVLTEPWRPGALDRIGPEDRVFVLGTGLTFLDTLAVLRARRHEGPILASSRRGLLPRPHGARGEPVPWPVTSPNDALGLLRLVRSMVKTAEAEGRPWTTVIDGLRHHVPALWRRLPVEERARFLRHVRPYWEVHRHRAPDPALAYVRALRQVGQLDVIAGRLLSVERAEGGVALRLSRRGSAAIERRVVDHIVVATGPGDVHDAEAGPLCVRLLSRGHVARDALGLGYRSSDDGAALGSTGRPTPGLWLLGPLRKPARWESTAVPEIREQARILAGQLAPAMAPLALGAVNIAAL